MGSEAEVSPSLVITSRNDTAEITVARNDTVPEVLWSRVIAEWGLVGPDPTRRIMVPIERFLSQLAWLGPACRMYRVGIDWDENTRRLIGASQAERRALDAVVAGLTPLPEESVRKRLSDSRFTRELRPFQLRDLGKLLALPNGSNFSVPGAGKTAVAYALYECERRAGRVARLLVVAPLSAYDAWVTEAKECFSEVPVIHAYDGSDIPANAEICLVNYQRLASAYEDVSRWVASQPCHVILDEAHRMKRGWTGEWGKSSLNLAYLASRRDILTGTPAPQSMRDLEALLDFAWPGQARRILPVEVFERSPPGSTPSLVAQALRPLFVRTTKSDLRLPQPTHNAIIVPLEGLQAQIYRALRNQYAGAFVLSRRDRSDFAKMGEVVMYLLEAASNPQLLAAGASQFDAISFRHPPLALPPQSTLPELLASYGRYETPRKFVELAKLIKQNADLGRKTLVWTNFVRNILTLERLLARYEPAIIHGGIPSEIAAPNASRTRENELDRFRNSNKCLVLLANPAATSEGVSLHHDCSDAIYLDRTFNAGQFLQSVDRIHRLGIEEDHETRITFLITASTIDEVVDGRIREKAERLGALLEDHDIISMALPDEEDYGRAIETDEDLVALFAHLRGGVTDA
jgi:SNF2 family DNA or RNA helicase